MALLPARNIFDGTATPVTSTMKTAMGSLRDYLAALLGTDSSNTAAARTALGAATAGANADITSLTALTSINGGQLAGLRNRIINGGFAVNQRAYVSGTAVGAGLYGHDRWKMAASGDTYTFSTTVNKTTVTIPAGKVLRQVVEGLNLETGTYCLSWQGTAQGKIGAGAYGVSGITGAITGGTDTTIEFGPGTVSNVQLEFGSVATVFEQRPYGLELALCQRYYESTGAVNMFSGDVTNGVAYYNTVYFKATKRVVPTITNTVAYGAGFNLDAAYINYATTEAAMLGKIATAAVNGAYFQYNLEASAEL